MRLSLRPILTALAAGLALTACDDGLSVDGSRNQCFLGSVTRSISVGETQSGTLTNLNCRIGESRATGRLFDLAQTTRVQIDLTSGDFDPLLVLTDRNLTILAFDDDSGEGSNSRMWQNRPAGSYVLWVTTVTAGELGDFELSVEEQEGASCSETLGQLALPDTVTGELTSTSCLTEGESSFADPWLLELSETTSIQVDLLSADFDAVLRVTDMEDEEILSDDDGGEGTDAHLAVELEPGSYKIWATTFAPGEMGAYELRVQPAAQGAAALHSVDRGPWASSVSPRSTSVDARTAVTRPN